MTRTIPREPVSTPGCGRCATRSSRTPSSSRKRKRCRTSSSSIPPSAATRATSGGEKNRRLRARIARGPAIPAARERATRDPRRRRDAEGGCGRRPALEWLARELLVYFVEHYRDPLSEIISETVERWDPSATSQRIELHIGRDLQFIRVNGTLVGGLVGLGIYLIWQAAA